MLRGTVRGGKRHGCAEFDVFVMGEVCMNAQGICVCFPLIFFNFFNFFI